MNKTEKFAKLRTLQTELDALRRELDVSASGEIIYRSDLDVTSDDTLLVEADGFGGARIIIVEGHYPVDYTTKFEMSYPTESEAETAAEELASHKRTPNQFLASTE